MDPIVPIQETGDLTSVEVPRAFTLVPAEISLFPDSRVIAVQTAKGSQAVFDEGNITSTERDVGGSRRRQQGTIRPFLDVAETLDPIECGLDYSCP